mgnify:CR=1 FL=1
MGEGLENTFIKNSLREDIVPLNIFPLFIPKKCQRRHFLKSDWNDHQADFFFLAQILNENDYHSAFSFFFFFFLRPCASSSSTTVFISARARQSSASTTSFSLFCVYARHLSPFAGSFPSLPSTPLLYHKNPSVSRKNLKKFYKKT